MGLGDLSIFSEKISGEMNDQSKAFMNKYMADELAKKSGASSGESTLLQKMANAEIVEATTTNNNNVPVVYVNTPPQNQVQTGTVVSSNLSFDTSNNQNSSSSSSIFSSNTPSTTPFFPLAPASSSTQQAAPSAPILPTLSCEHAKETLLRCVKIFAEHLKETGFATKTTKFDQIYPYVTYVMTELSKIFTINGCAIDNKILEFNWQNIVNGSTVATTQTVMLTPMAVSCDVWQTIIRQISYIMGYLGKSGTKTLDKTAIDRSFMAITTAMAGVFQANNCATNMDDLRNVYNKGRQVQVAK